MQINICVNCNSDNHDSMDRRCPIYKDLCRQEEELETNIILSSSPNSYDSKKKLNTTHVKQTKSTSYLQAAGFSNEFSLLKQELSHVSSTVYNLSQDLKERQDSMLEKMTTIFQKSMAQLKTEISNDIEEKMDHKTALNNTNLIMLIAKESSENLSTQKAKQASLFRSAKDLNIPILINNKNTQSNSKSSSNLHSN